MEKFLGNDISKTQESIRQDNQGSIFGWRKEKEEEER